MRKPSDEDIAKACWLLGNALPSSVLREDIAPVFGWLLAREKLLNAVVESRCFEHADTCCYDWCLSCHKERTTLDALDAFDRDSEVSDG